MAEVGLTSVTVKWKPIPEGSRNGALTRYLVRYKKFSDNEFKYLSTASTVFEGQLTDVEKDTFYSIQVAGTTFSGVGVYSHEIITRTKKCMLIILIYNLQLHVYPIIIIFNAFWFVNIIYLIYLFANLFCAVLAFQMILVVLHV